MMQIEGVRFSCTDGSAEVITLKIRLSEITIVNKKEQWLYLYGGVTGWESICIKGKYPTDRQRLIACGWWACAGTPNNWDSLYIHGLQMAKLFKEIDDAE